MFSRQAHRKSRKGCLPCKRRHVKCGEEHPHCQNCIDYDLQCEYRAAPPSVFSRSSLSPSSTQRFPTLESSYPQPLLLGLTSATESSQTSPCNAGKLNIADLELLHHFSTVTYITMSNVADEQNTWQSTMVRIGFKYPFLLHGLLAFSALHLGYLNPVQSLSYLLTASSHQDRAISQFREIFTSVSPSNFDPILAFSCLLPLHSLANTTTSRLRKHISDQETLSSFLGSVRLLRGVNNFVPYRWQIPSSSCMICLAQVALRNLPEALTYPGIEALDRLQDMCSSLLNTSSGGAPAPHIFMDAIALLRKTFARLATKTAFEQFTVGIILLWMYDLSEEFISLLSSSNAMGLTILAHYATLLYRQNHVWWIEGLGSTLIGAISAILGEEWADILAWPKKVANIT
ncbi:hypothetical protein OIDMADRAFT_126021 [Oidiodendron maius Zn]|uniref:Zn(2)-C6 fungal-type domain-containing protein n=1 Tax=Oidiodendron maius (strain Zn) TaxID=913774 RepID=A0A0C3CLZ5_OIDMZ|nr:hypothetical protein OIDMADRAFT_126021 [Oidiodendron maius Zn]